MPQLHCYVPDEISSKLQSKAEQAHLSVSKYLAQLIRRDVGGEWPEDYFDLFGSWEAGKLGPCNGQGRMNTSSARRCFDVSAGY